MLGERLLQRVELLCVLLWQGCSTTADGSAPDTDTGIPCTDGFGLFYRDVDGDGFGDPGSGLRRCIDDDPEWTRNSDDCDDTDSGISPVGVDEFCGDGIDGDCDNYDGIAGECRVAYVGCDGLPDIQTGVRVVAENGVVEVCAGAYVESIDIEKSLTLRRRGGPSEVVTISGGDQGVAIRVAGEVQVVLEGLTFTDSVGFGLEGGAVSAWFSAVTIDGCSFEDNFSRDGGGAVNLWDSDAVIKNSTFKSNGSSKGGGAVRVVGYDRLVSVEIRNTLIESSYLVRADDETESFLPWGVAILSDGGGDGAKIKIVDSEISRNLGGGASEVGGSQGTVLFASRGTLDVRGTSIRDNATLGLFCAFPASVSMEEVEGQNVFCDALGRP